MQSPSLPGGGPGEGFYRGRFAPSPTGPLHFGSLVAALGSALDARSRGGEWLLRMEDVDPPRVVPGASAAILATLETYGFTWDGPVLWQSQRGEAYQAALDGLRAAGRVYGCRCSRKQLAGCALPGVDGPIYPGTCRGRPVEAGSAQRFQVLPGRTIFQDALLGRVGCDLAAECGDFVLKRADGVFTYQLAVVVDDAEQGITHVVRGADLLASTPRQIALQQALGLPTPEYLHLPVVLDAAGDKLSKQTRAAPLDDAHPLPTLLRAAHILGLEPEPDILSPREFWEWAVPRWRRQKLPALRGRVLALQD